MPRVTLSRALSDGNSPSWDVRARGALERWSEPASHHRAGRVPRPRGRVAPQGAATTLHVAERGPFP